MRHCLRISDEKLRRRRDGEVVWLLIWIDKGVSREKERSNEALFKD